MAARLLAAAFVAQVSVSAEPVLHERFVPDPAEDLRLGATTPSGALPAALDTRSGLVSAPTEVRRSSPGEAGVYGGASTPSSADASYHVDRLTSRPSQVRYDEPFRPSILPFKRLYAFDALRDDLSFGVRSDALVQVPVGGAARDSEDAFFGDFEVDLVAGVPVRIPSVGPGTRIVALHVDPPQAVSVLEDSAENWFVRAENTGRARMVLQLTIDRDAFGRPYPRVQRSALAPALPPVPSAIRDSAEIVAAHIGVSAADPPQTIVRKLVDYFRQFKESEELPTAEGTEALYVELALEQKGVCRHRAYAFATTALALGIPARVVHNEAHAWVEVFDGEIWQRLDLGGAAMQVQRTRQDATTPQHRPPEDPYAWPSQAQPGQALAGPSASQRRASAAAAGRADGDRTPGWPLASHTSPSSQSARVPSGGLQGTPPVDRVPTEPSPRVTLTVDRATLKRGQPVRVSGRATHEGRPCRLSRIDFFIDGESAPLPIGSVSTDRAGYFLGPVTIPRDAPVGEVSLRGRLGAGCQ